MDALQQLETVTHVIQYSPNCQSRYLVRLVGPAAGRIDMKSYGSLFIRAETKDVLGFGRTLEEAAEAAFRAEHVAKQLFHAKLLLPVTSPSRSAREATV